MREILHRYALGGLTAVKNTGDEPATFEMLSSFMVSSLSPFSTGLAPECLKVHRLRSTWSAEGRFVTESAEDLQLEVLLRQQRAIRQRGQFPVRGLCDFAAAAEKAAADCHITRLQRNSVLSRPS